MRFARTQSARIYAESIKPGLKLICKSSLEELQDLLSKLLLRPDDEVVIVSDSEVEIWTAASAKEELSSRVQHLALIIKAELPIAS